MNYFKGVAVFFFFVATTTQLFGFSGGRWNDLNPIIERGSSFETIGGISTASIGKVRTSSFKEFFDLKSPNSSSPLASGVHKDAFLPDLTIDVSVSNSNPFIESTVTFTVNLLNDGPDLATGINVAALLPSGYVYQSDNSAGAYNSLTGSWTVGDLDPAESTFLSITAQVIDTDDYDFTVNATSAEDDENGDDNSDSISVTPVFISDLSVDKTASSNSPEAGS